MEEAWELAVVSDLNDAHKFYGLDAPKPLELLEFSESSRGIQLKFVTVSLISIFLSIFELDPTSSFFGIKVTNLNERAMELGFFLVTVSLGLLYFFRIWEERHVILQQHQIIKKIHGWYKGEAESITASHTALVENLKSGPLIAGDTEKEIECAFINIGAAFDQFIQQGNELDEFAASEQFRAQVSDPLLKTKNLVKEKSKEILDIVRHTRVAIDGNMEQWTKALKAIQELDSIPKKTRRFGHRRQFRLCFFDIILPAVALLICILSFAFPNNGQFLLV